MSKSSNSKWGKKFFAKYKKQLLIGQLVLVFCLGIFFHWIFSDSSNKIPVTATGASVQQEEEQPKFWTCSMHPSIQKQGPGKCPLCGMDLIPVLSKGKKTGGMRQIVISDAARALLNVQTVPVERRYVTAEVRMVGKVDYDETRLGYITAWIPGRLDRLYVDYTGVEVKEGDHMVYIYSPELYSTQDELIQVVKRAREHVGKSSIFPDVADLIEPARERLRLWGMTVEQIREIEESEKPSDHLTVYSPMRGIVIEKTLQEGDYVKTGDRIYTVADLSHVWVMMDAYESDLVWLRYGQETTFITETYPGEEFVGRIAFIDPVLNAKTRTVKVRVNVPNHSGKLKPEMFVHGVVRTQIATGGKVVDPYMVGKWICPMHPEIIKGYPGECDSCGMPLMTAESLGYAAVDSNKAPKPLVIPVTAALVTGTRALVYVDVPDTDEPTFEGREIVLGPRAGDYYLVRNGLKEGEMVVTNGNFKIDSAVQLLAQPSMMTPYGGGGHKTGGGDDVPAEFQSHLQTLESAYEAVAEAVKLKDIGLFHDEINAFGNALSKVDGTLLSGHLRMLWDELSMLLDNDAVDGSSVVKLTGIERVLNELTGNMRRVRSKFGISHDAQRPQLSQHPEVPAEFQSQLVKLWEGYLSLQESISGGDFSLTQQAVTQFQTSLSSIDAGPLAEEAHKIWKKENDNLVQILQSMSQLEDLKSIRKNFSSLSNELMVLVKTFEPAGFGTVYQLHCPMVFGGKGAIWLQGDKQVRNPYDGQAMLKCADRVELISGGKTKEQKEERQAQHPEVPAEFQSQLVKLWEGYLLLQEALAGDELSLAHQAIADIQTSLSSIDSEPLAEEAHKIWKKENDNLVQILQSMSQSEDLKSIRKNFSLLSDELMVLVKTFEPAGFGTVYRLHCPMVFGGKGAIWLQGDKQVRNPYYGKAMLKCADRVELIFNLPVRSTQTGGKTKEQEEGRQVQHLEVPAEFQSQLVKLWELYLFLQHALSCDDCSLAHEAITDLKTALSSIDAGSLAEDAHKVWKKENDNLVQILQSMSQPEEDLKSIRENFSLLSEVFVVLVKTFEPAAIGTVYRLHCPMVFGGKGAIWLQCDKQVSNPYFGTAMLKCADRAELIFSGKTKEQKEGRQVQHLEVPAEFQSQLVKLWEGYLSLQQALSRDDPSLAIQTISDLQTTLWSIDAGPLTEEAHKIWKKENDNLVQILQSMSLSEGLISIRESFPLLSDELMMMIKTFGPAGFGTVYQLHCPMVFGGKGAVWLQGDKQAKNPYYGKAMLKCADRAELISSLPVRSTQTGGKTKEQKERRQAQRLEVPAEFQSQLAKLWKGYLSLQQALSGDELSLAHQAIADIHTSLSSIDAGPLAEDAHKVWKKENDNLVQILQSMSQSEGLKSIRKNFSSLSDGLMVLVKTFKPAGFGTVYRLHCPMAFGGKGAIWLQGDKQVKNPYLGTAMQKCSDRVELISDLPASDAQAGTQTGGKTKEQKEEHKGEHHHE